MTVEEVIKEFKMVSEPGLNDGRRWPYEKVKLLVDEIVRLQVTSEILKDGLLSCKEEKASYRSDYEDAVDRIANLEQKNSVLEISNTRPYG